jgi:hypothetical protein
MTVVDREVIPAKAGIQFWVNANENRPRTQKAEVRGIPFLFWILSPVSCIPCFANHRELFYVRLYAGKNTCLSATQTPAR